MTLKELREKRAALWNTMKGFLDERRNDKGVLSAEDDATYASMEKDLDALTNEINREERRAEIEAQLNKPTSQPIVGSPEPAAKIEPQKTGRASNEYKEDFGRMLRGVAPIHDVMTVGTDANGGYLVPDEFDKNIAAGLAEANVIRGISKVITTQYDHKIPVVTTHATAAWTAESGAYNESTPVLGQKSLDAHKMTSIIRVSEELMQDSAFNIEAFVTDEIISAFGALEEQAFCVGTGSGQPTGIFTANGGTVGVTSKDSTAITMDEIFDLIYALKSPYRKNAKFLTNDNTVRLIRKLKDANGAYLWQPTNIAGQPDKLAGFDLITTPYAPTIAAGNRTIAFGDFKNFWVADRRSRTVKRLGELYAANGQIGFAAAQRVDGKVIVAEAIQLLQMKA